ncbi:DUF1566 domain-containing protein [Desulfovibrio inopinatus]|uniref:Lcl C-terminal domain-containing protein n=1 Tax=Desulfovibrio inopinatus TaxID=102109 RepID=UPI0003F8D9A7|nr:DUF1566 domain-containing protein [Desulfovibrio inopinatus]
MTRLSVFPSPRHIGRGLLFAFIVLCLASPLRAEFVDTGQNACYDTNAEILCPEPKQSFYGQDAQYDSAAMRYLDNGDGTVTDLVTGLMWQQTPEQMTWSEALAAADTYTLANYEDWRLPTIKELYSLIDFRGHVQQNETNSTPFINTQYFNFSYGDTTQGERLIDAQYWSSTHYVSTTMGGGDTAFGVNFADGRIKGYPTNKTNEVLFVRGSTGWGVNAFVDNGDGTITDTTTGLMWLQQDSGAFEIGPETNGAVNWEDALAFAEGLAYAGYDDWRLPNAKELQSLVDYTRSPDTTDSAAIDPIFESTAIVNEGGQRDFGYYWTSTTHMDGPIVGIRGAYLCFGRCLGFMTNPITQEVQLLDVHGAGAQRSDPKNGNPDDYPTGFGPQGDVIRIFNYARPVRTVMTSIEKPSSDLTASMLAALFILLQ